MSTTIDDVWQIIAELAEAQKTTEERFQAAEYRFQETERLLTAQAQETDRRFQETDRRFQETDRRFQETDRLIRVVNKQIGDLGGKWGRFVENMVAPACETLFIKRGIPVHQVSQRVKRKLNGETLEIDVMVTNENHILVVEVKSSLGVEDVKALVNDLNNFHRFFPDDIHKHIYGAIAGIEIEDGADKYAYRQGLFVLAQAGESVAVLNGDNFTPKTWWGH